MSQAEAARQVGRSERWVRKWVSRYRVEGSAGLVEQSRAPRTRPSATPAVVVAKILATRDALEASEFAGVGAESILYELTCEGFSPLPSLSTVERTLRRAGRTTRRRRDRRTERHRPRPPVEGPGRLHQADWVGPRWLAKRVRFSSLHVVDVGGGGAAAAQRDNERLEGAAEVLLERVWPLMGVPLALQVDNAFVLEFKGRPSTPFNLFVRLCLFFGVEVIIVPPNELGWQNHVESFNALWQARTIRRHRYGSVEEVAAASDRFTEYYLHRRPHPALAVERHGTRFPGALLAASAGALRFPPTGVVLSDHRDSRGRVQIPLARGRVTYLRRVLPGGVIQLAGQHYPVPTSTEGLCVAATVVTARRRLFVRLDGDVIADHALRIAEGLVEPYFPMSRRGLYYDIEG